MRTTSITRAGAFVVAGALYAIASTASTQEFEAQNQALQAEIQKLAQELQELNRRLEANREAIARLNETSLKISNQGGLALQTADGQFEIKPRGRILVDANTLGGTTFRAARMGLQGKVYGDYKFKFEVDFAGNAVSLADAVIEYTGLEPLSFSFGHQQEPFSLEEQTSSRFITFMERALPNAFAPGRNMGIIVKATDEALYTAAAGVFGSGVDCGGGATGCDLGITGRGTLAPIATDTQLIHLGLGATYRDNGDDAFRIRNRPETRPAPRLIDTGALGASVDNHRTINPEIALAYERFSLQGEYMHMDVSRDPLVSGAAGDDVEFDGWYVYGSVFLTGESRAAFYNPGDGAFGRVKPIANLGKGSGAIELGVRYSTLDLTDGTVGGGEEDNITVGLNWYLNPNVRTMLNYINADINRPAAGIVRSVDLVATRVQIDW